MGAAVGTFLFGLAIIAGLGIYFLPAVVALGRKHRSTAAIFVLNLFLGWTLLFWVIALVWAFTATGDRQKKTDAPRGQTKYSSEIRAEIIKAESRIDGMIADQIVTAQGLEEWLRARGWQRDYARFGNLDWYSPRYGVSISSVEEDATKK